MPRCLHSCRLSSRCVCAAATALLAAAWLSSANAADRPARKAPPATAPASQPATSPWKSSDWTDLLTLGPEQPTKRKPQWKVVDGVLEMPRVAGGNRCSLVEDGPTGAYELTLTFNRKQGDREFAVILPIGDIQGQVWMGGGAKGQSSSVQGIRNPHLEGMEIVNGKEQVLLLSVRPSGENATVTATLDGKPYFEATGPRAKMRAVRGYAVPGDHPRVIALVVNGESSLSFKEIKLKLSPPQ